MKVLTARGLGFRYPENGFEIKNVSFCLEEGDFLGILGPNGAGKSTLLRLVSGLLPPSTGAVELCGDPVKSLSALDIARRLAWVPQELSTLFNLTVLEMVRLGRFAHRGFWRALSTEDERQVALALAETDLTGLRHRSVGELSGGERRRVLLARALAQEPRVLLLDEPTTHLDPRHQDELLSVIGRLRRERRLAVAAVLHDVNLALAWCPQIFLLQAGRMLAAGPVQETMNEENLGLLYGLRANLHHAGGRRFIYFESRRVE